MEQKKKNPTCLCRLFIAAFSLLLVAGTAAAQTPGVRFPAAKMTVGEALRTLEVQGKKTVAANLAHLDLDREITLPQTQGTLEEMTAAVMRQVGLQYRITDANIIVLPPRAEEPVVPVFRTPDVPQRDNDERVTFNGKYSVMSVSLGGKQAVKTEYPSQEVYRYVPAQKMKMSGIALKTNFLYAATLTPNLGLEFAVGKRSTIDVSAGYNFYEPDSGKMWKHWLVQPEYRWWFCERFNGAFIGGHLLGGQFNFAGIDFPLNVFDDLKDNRYEGEFYGVGAVFGYQWILGRRWSLEMAIGAGYVRAEYDKYGCNTCGPALKSGSKNYFGPTKASVSLLFFL